VKLIDNLFIRRYKKYNIQFATKSQLSYQYLYCKGISNIKNIGVGLNIDQLNTNNETENIVSCFMSEMRDKGNHILLYVGQISRRRNIILMINIVSKILDKNYNCILVIVGEGEKKYVNECKKLILKNKLEKNIYFFNKMNQFSLTAVYRETEAFIFPTQYDIFGMVLMEAMYNKCIVFSSLNGGSTELINNNINGFILKSFNTEEWAQKIIDSFSFSLEKKDLILSTAKQTIISKFTWDKISEKFLRLYKSKLSLKY